MDKHIINSFLFIADEFRNYVYYKFKQIYLEK